VGVDFGAFDGKPIQHFFLLCAPNVRDHLFILSRLSRLLSQPGFRTKLAAAGTPAQVLETVRQTERSLTR
jgi:mannitol/fructose-specific phosphotransferase system IIA component (Ntr-type)